MYWVKYLCNNLYISLDALVEPAVTVLINSSMQYNLLYKTTNGYSNKPTLYQVIPVK